MKSIIRIAILSAAILMATGCKSFSTLSNGGKKNAQGSPYELLVVCQGPEWEGAVGEELRDILMQPVPMINQNEPLFNVIRITANDFKNILLAHRNILKVVVSPGLAESSIKVQYDVDAAPQIVLTLQGPSQQSIVDYLRQNGDNLLYVLEMAERDRTIRFAERHSVKPLTDLILNMFGVEMKVPQGYELRAQSDDFVWISYEFPTSSQGFFMYSYPYTGKGSLTPEELVRVRNMFAGRIPGPSDGSYMTTVDKIPDAESDKYVAFTPDCQAIRIGDRVWLKMSGLWEVENDFMGGPFVSYTTVNENTGRVLTLDCYVYSPKLGKRNHLRALEHLVYLIEFPSAPAGEAAEQKPGN